MMVDHKLHTFMQEDCSVLAVSQCLNEFDTTLSLLEYLRKIDCFESSW